MFQGLLKRAERSLDQVIARVVGRALVAVPLLVAAGFATAALTVKLVEQYGAVTAYGVMAALFSLIGLVTMAIVGAGTHAEGEPAAAESAPSTSESENAESESLADAADFLTPEMRSMFASAAPMALPAIVRGVGRNLPLIFLLAVVAYIVSRFAGTPDEAAAAEAGDAGETAGTSAEPPAAAA